MQQAADGLTTLLQSVALAGSRLRAAASPDEVAEALLRDARRLLRCQAGAVRLVEGEHLRLLVAHNDVIPPAALTARRGERVPLDGRSVAAHVARGAVRVTTREPTALAGLEWDDAFEARHGFRTRALMALPLLGRDGRGLAVLELQNPVGGDGDAATFSADHEELAAILAAQAGLALEHAVADARGRAEQAEIVFTLAAMPEHRDPDIRWHVRRISGYSRVLARSMGLDDEGVRLVELASALHDVGKVGIPPEILLKPGKLTDEEFGITREHCTLGHQLLSDAGAPLLERGAEVALSHHERWDGEGYPRGLAGAAIPLSGRIVAIADVFDALTTRRTYKPAMGIEQSLRILGLESGKHFDPDLVDAFQRVFSDILDVKRQFTPDG
ncbi:MAG: HD domain-containing protein [Planctomycetes bacterium]|nr:HD domain-containing protein [Planctomycetota bacterium]